MIESTHDFLTGNSFDQLNIGDESVQLIVTSPPYPMVEMWDDIFGTYHRGIKTSIEKGEGNKVFEKMHRLLDQCWSECYRVLAPSGFMIINVGNATRSLGGQFEMFSNHSRIMQACKKIGFDILPYIIWNKPTNAPNKFMGSGVLPAGAYVTLEHEYILVFRKGGKRQFTKLGMEHRRRSAFFWEERNKWFCDQWNDIRGTSQKFNLSANRDRSGAYPFEVAKRLILMYSLYEETVLDPFSGTGTTTQAAMTFGRNSIYIDCDQDLVLQSKSQLSQTDDLALLNQQITARIEDHKEYVNSREHLFFKHHNDIINTPVKSSQEKLLKPFLIKDITSTTDRITVSYQDYEPL